MATINATLSLSSSDLSSNSLSLSNTMTMTKAGTLDGLEKTTGLHRKSYLSTNHVDLLVAGSGRADEVTAGKANKIYIKNTGSSSTEYFEVGLGTSSGSDTATSDAISGTHLAIGKLYGGDWMFFPWDGGDGNDVEITPSSTTDTTLEYILLLNIYSF